MQYRYFFIETLKSKKYTYKSEKKVTIGISNNIANILN